MHTYGQEVDFRIAVFNQIIPADNVVITDYIPSGFLCISAYGWTFDGINKADANDYECSHAGR
ncbi:MAG: hypothetical protein IPL98_13175 [Saprospiraceae bacterium]|nr:hypothetical protein [Saprospiraceae bacterium]